MRKRRPKALIKLAEGYKELKDAISPSRVARIHETTVAHLLSDMEKGREPSTPAQIRGTATHVCLFEHDKIDKKLIVTEKPAFGGKGVTAEVKEQRQTEWAATLTAADKNRQTIISPDEFKIAKACADSVTNLAAHMYVKGTPEAPDGFDFAASLIESDFYPEQKVGWIDEETGIECHGIIDAVGPRLEWLGDLKTTRDASIEAFSRELYNRRYHLKLSMYADAIKSVTGIAPRVFVPVVETSEPYEARLFEVHEMTLDEGRIAYRQGLASWAKRETPGRWNGYPPVSSYISIPRWAMSRSPTS